MSINRTFDNLPIRTKLVAFVVIVTVVSIGAGFLALGLNNVDLRKKEAFANAQLLARVVADSSGSALVQGDSNGAKKVLGRLSGIPEVSHAFIYDRQGRIFASFSRGSGAASVPILSDGADVFQKGLLIAESQITFDSEAVGSLKLFVSTAALEKKILHDVELLGTIFLAVIVFSSLVAWRLQRYISAPILELAGIAKKISQEPEYDIKVERRSHDEIGRLYTAFGDLLQAINRRRQEKEEALSALRQSEARFRNVVQDQTELIVRYEADGTIAFVNEAYCKFFGLSDDELLGRSLFELIPLQHREQVAAIIESISPDEPVVTHEQRMHRRDGEERWFSWTNRGIIVDGEIEEYQGVGRDITQSKRMQLEKERLAQQLNSSQRLETIGTMAGGIAHDFNNILTPIIGYVELAEKDLPVDHPAVNKLRVIGEGANRARELVQHILAFSREAEQSREPVEIAHVVLDCVKLLRASIPRTVDIRTTVSPDTGLVLGDESQLHQVILNLCTNAAYSMRETGGTLSVELDAVQLAGDQLPEKSELSAGNYVLIRVKDTGCGIDPNALDKIFDPFFTTKPVGEGTGLGLSVVHGIVAKHDGHIDVQSEVGVGTSFSIYLPSCEEPGSEVALEHRELVGGDEKILFIDDEEFIRIMAEELLQRLGYSVMVASNASEALEMLDQVRDGVDLVITDQTMPGKTGLQLAEELRAKLPSLPIVLCTGFGGSSFSVDDAQSSGVACILKKPYELHELSSAIREALASAYSS